MMLNPLHNQYNHEELWALDRDHFLHPWTHFDSFKDEGSLVLVKGKGCRVTDSEGKEYFDGIGGMWCVNVGYGRDELAQTMAQQASQLAYSNTFVDVSNAPAATLAGKLASMAPGSINRVMYALTGSAANEGAVRLAQYYHGRKGRSTRKHIISRKNSYHGSTVLTSSIGMRDGDRQEEFQYLTGFIHHLSAPYFYRGHDGMTKEEFTDFLVQEFRDKIAELGAENISCFIAEPIQASGGVVPPPPGYLKRMIEVCREHDILFIADEVVTAFGRLGHMFASLDEFGIQPDIIVCAKGITSGYFPMGATLYTDEIHEVMSSDNPDGWFAHGFTCAGHPVGCAVALKNIEIMEREDICGNVRTVGDYFEGRLRELDDLPIVGDVRGKRMMMCVEYVADKNTKAHIPYEVNISKRISNLCESRGLLVRPMGHLDVMSPPLTMTKDDADFLVDTLRGAVVEVTDELVREGVL
jgi:adenosylmethionine-8-amino-7-oxononanoate aminotransferase